MDRFDAMRAFVKVSEVQGFAEAARQLLMSPPGVTRAIATLETNIGTKLFVRTTRSVKLTEAGERYYESCKRILADVKEAEAAAAGLYAMPVGQLTITASVMFGRLHVLPIVTEFLDRYSSVTVRASFVDRIANLVEEGIDVAVRIGELPDSSLHAMKGGEVRRVICASPEYLARRNAPIVPSDLTHHQIVASVGARTSLEWRFGLDEKISVNVHPRLVCNTNDAAIAAVTAGWGITRVLSYQIREEIADGRLVVLLPESEPAPLPINIVYGEGRSASAKVRAFVDLAVQRLREKF